MTWTASYLLLAFAGLPTPKGGPPQPTAIAAHHHSGQTFLTWEEASHEAVAKYRIYRHDAPITAKTLCEAQLIGEARQDSSLFYADRYYRPSTLDWAPRYLARYVIVDGGPELSEGVGLFVWTPSDEELGGVGAGDAYYAVTSVDAQGVENAVAFDGENSLGPIAEVREDPLPVLSKVGLGGKVEIYTQFLDLHGYNPTLAAPNSYNDWYGLDENDPDVAQAIQYAFTYAVFVPYPGCQQGGVEGGLHPIVVNTHGYGGEKARPFDFDPNPTWCNAFRIHPIDPVNTWWFGHARDHDYRQDLVVTAGDTIVNYTEQRVLRMVHDLARHPTYGSMVDLERVFVFGHSMGGSGSLAFALRYPNVFAAAHASQPMTDYSTSGDGGGDDWRPDVSVKLGAPMLDLPIDIEGPAGWADHLEGYDGTPAWQWQDHQAQTIARRGEEAAPFGVDHSLVDTIIEWATQGQPAYEPFDASDRCWRGVIQSTSHTPSGILGMPGPFGKDAMGLPFAGFRARLGETVPGLARSTLNGALPPVEEGDYNADLDWSASWADWDGPPLDEPTRWRVSLRTDIDTTAVVDVTPRRAQAFVVEPGVPYVWHATEIASLTEFASGLVLPDDDGLVTAPAIDVDEFGTRVEFEPAFAAQPATLSIAAGGSQVMELSTSAQNGGRLYFVLGSISGTSPGLPIGDGVVLPLEYDAYFDLTIANPNSALLGPSLALLDPLGEAACQFNLPAGLPPELVGLTLHHAFLVVDEFGIVVFASNAVALTLEP